MMGKFVVSTTSSGFRFNLKADNGQTILTSETYNSKASCLNGIESVKKNAGDDNKYERVNAKDGRPYFNLKASNGQIIGTSQMYADAAGRDNGIESVKKNAAAASTVEE